MAVDSFWHWSVAREDKRTDFLILKQNNGRIGSLYILLSALSFLNDNQYSMWLLFVRACSLLCSHAILRDAINSDNHHIHHYCSLFEAEFGRESCYPNLHMHCHLKQCLLVFGPAASFWLFAFEWMNGVVGSFHTSNRAVEVQLFRKF